MEAYHGRMSTENSEETETEEDATEARSLSEDPDEEAEELCRCQTLSDQTNKYHSGLQSTFCIRFAIRESMCRFLRGTSATVRMIANTDKELSATLRVVVLKTYLGTLSINCS